MKSLDASATHVTWSADIAPRIHIRPGDTIEVETSLGAGARYLESATPQDIREVVAASPGISMTGPIFVEGAEPGDVLGVEVCGIPLQERIETVGDDADLQEVYDTERHLLYVARTRARDHLLVTGVDPASEFLLN